MADTMRAMAIVNKGVGMIEVPKPTPNKGEVSVKVIASSINPAEDKLVKGEFVGRFLHAKTSPLIIGWDFAGTVDAIGEGVSDIEEGTAVWGHLPFSNTTKQGTFSEYITLSRDELAVKPDNMRPGLRFRRLLKPGPGISDK